MMDISEEVERKRANARARQLKFRSKLSEADKEIIRKRNANRRKQQYWIRIETSFETANEQRRSMNTQEDIRDVTGCSTQIPLAQNDSIDSPEGNPSLCLSSGDQHSLNSTNVLHGIVADSLVTEESTSSVAKDLENCHTQPEQRSANRRANPYTTNVFLSRDDNGPLTCVSSPYGMLMLRGEPVMRTVPPPNDNAARLAENTVNQTPAVDKELAKVDNEMARRKQQANPILSPTVVIEHSELKREHHLTIDREPRNIQHNHEQRPTEPLVPIADSKPQNMIMKNNNNFLNGGGELKKLPKDIAQSAGESFVRQHGATPMLKEGIAVHKKKIKQRRLRQAEKDILWMEFRRDPYPSTQEKRRIAEQLQMPLQKIHGWFQHERNKIIRKEFEQAQLAEMMRQEKNAKLAI